MVSLETGLPSSGSVSFTTTASRSYTSRVLYDDCTHQETTLMLPKHLLHIQRSQVRLRMPPRSLFWAGGEEFWDCPRGADGASELPCWGHPHWARPEEEAGQHRQTIVAPIDLTISTGSSKLNCWGSLQLRGLHLFESRAVSSSLITTLQEPSHRTRRWMIQTRSYAPFHTDWWRSRVTNFW